MKFGATPVSLLMLAAAAFELAPASENPKSKIFPNHNLQSPSISLQRVLYNGIQSKVVRDEQGTVHLLYYSGDAAHGDVYYTNSVKDGAAWLKPIRVNAVKG